MNFKYSQLFKPLNIRSKTFKNRILSGPLGCNQENPPTELLQVNVDYYGALARGGCARVIAGGDSVVSEDGGYPGGMGRVQLFLHPHPMQLHMSLRNYVNTMHRYQCLAFMQLTHNGGPTGPGPMGPMVSKGVSDYEMPDGSKSIAYTKDELEQLADSFALCARRIKDAGMDGCVVHAGHGKLLDQFRASDFNHRTDEFGGSLENRARFPRMVMQRMRDAVGDDFIIEYRTSVDERCEGGITLEESIEFFKLLESDHTVDLFHITAGRHFDPKQNAYCISPATFPSAPNRTYCKAIKDAGIKTPLVIINSCADPDIAEDIIASGDADMICLSRQIDLADPYYPRKLREGHPELVDNCLRCHGCYDVAGPCSVNPHASYKTYESYYPMQKSPISRKVCIVGGGIGGLKAAYTAAERGHSVILFEKSDVLGGQLIFSDTDTYKTDIRRFKQNMVTRVLQHPNIEVRLHTEATPELIEAQQPYAVIAATGAQAKFPQIAGIEQDNVLTVQQAYTQSEKLGNHIVMIGSGLTACETALHLHRTGHRITLVGRRPKLCFHENFDHLPTALYDPRPTFLDWFEEKQIGLYLNTDCIGINGSSVKLKDVLTDHTFSIEADTIILAGGMQANTAEADAFRETAPYFAQIGDCIKPGKIRDAVFTGYWAAMEI